MDRGSRALYNAWWTSGPGGCVTCTEGNSVDAQTIRTLGVSFFPMRVFGPDRDDRPVRYLLVAMEPSAGWVKRYLKKGKDLADALNFGGAKSQGDSVLQFAVREWLCGDEETFLLTDIAKCAVRSTKEHPASATAPFRWRNCAPILEQEGALFHLRAVIAVGKGVHDELRSRAWIRRYPLFRVLHFSNVAAGHRDRVLSSEAERRIDDETVERYRAFVRERQAAVRKDHQVDSVVKVSHGTKELLAVYRKQLRGIKRAMADS